MNSAVPSPPLAMLAELTHRCPLQCPYCSNPLNLDKSSVELGTEVWQEVLDQAQRLGVMQIHFSGGEPTVRKDLEKLVAHAARIGLYSNLITSAVLLTEARVAALAEAGLDHVQISFQDSRAASADLIGGYRSGHDKKRQVARWVRLNEMPLTLNLVVHRANLAHLDELITMGEELDAHRIEIAHVQYYGWAYRNRAALMPTHDQLEQATATVAAARQHYDGKMAIDYVVPDYYARRPKACMGGWGQQFLNITPSGNVLPCHAAESLPGFNFDSVLNHDLAWIWEHSEAFNRFRGVDWMPEPCRSCDRREIDWGGCRCQAFAITGDAAATDPACEFSPHHDHLRDLANSGSRGDIDYVYRNYTNAPKRDRVNAKL